MSGDFLMHANLFQYLERFFYFTLGLITILNPLAAAAIMVSILGETANPNEVGKISFKTSLTVFVASLITLFAGDFIFKLFGINLPSLKVIGGVLLFKLSLDMLQGEISNTKHTKEESNEAKEKEDISIVPLGIPILFGPGVLTTLIVLKTRYNDIISLGLLLGAVLVSSLIVYLVLRYSYAIVNFIGVTGLKIATRIMGLVVGAIASEFLISGLKELWYLLH